MLGFVDVDGLKSTNDRDGHAAGDKLLLATAHALRSHLRSYEPVVRYGGDEFIFTLADVDLAQAESRVREIEEELAAEGASISVGLVQLEGGETLTDLISRADAAMPDGSART